MHEIRLREALRKARTEAEEELREKTRLLERRHVEEADALRADMALLKRKLEETQREADISKRKITLSKQDGKLEAQAEVRDDFICICVCVCVSVAVLLCSVAVERTFLFFPLSVTCCLLLV